MSGLFRRRRVGVALASVICVSSINVASAQMLIVGNDEKIIFDDAGKGIPQPPGKDSVSIVDISNPDAPKIVTTLSLINTIIGPPTNLAITPSGDIALIANSINVEPDGASWKNVPDDEIFVIDMKANPAKVIATVNAGKQPSGMAISAKGDLALVANRAAGTISVLSIKGKEVKVIDTVEIGAPTDSVSAVAITPDGKRALAVKAAANKVALLSIDGDKVTYDKRDLIAGIFPYNIGVTPDGKIAIVNNNGFGGGSDGNVDTVSVIDLEVKPERVIDHVVIGDAPEGFAISPKGNFAVTVLLQGSNADKKAFFYHPTGAVVALKIDGKKVTKVGEVQVGGLPEGVAFSPDGGYLYVGNFIDQDMSILKVDGDKLTDTGHRLKLPGHPASMRSGPQ
jgi:YVTN family beta-propeller protein